MVEMIKQTTAGVAISVETFYQPESSNPVDRIYRFAYRVLIENNNTFPIKLIQRHWYILDSHSTKRKETKSEGIDGIQPTILPGKSYRFLSGITLHTGLGKMHGHFLMKNQKDHTTFEVVLPEFEMTAPLKMN